MLAQSIRVVLSLSVSILACCSSVPPHTNSGPPVAIDTVVVKPARLEAKSSCESGVDGSKITNAILVLLSLTPTPGAIVQEATSLEAVLGYSIPNYAPHKYQLIVQFETSTAGMTLDGSFPNDQYPWACAPTGVFHITFPMQYVWDVAAITRPYKVKFLLLEQSGAMGMSVAESDRSTFQTE